ncbi:MAG TPA: amidohydrolase family protein [Acidimicrobiales bacterium]|nr:amidohydrolase family protein [Acidimicrobiales bacterium]
MAVTPHPRLGYTMVDADHHYYEPYDCFTRHIEAKYADQAVHHVEAEDGIRRTYIGDHPFAWRPFAVADVMGAPGASKGQVAKNPTMKSGEAMATIDPKEHPAFMNRDARIKELDSQGVEACVMLPTEAVIVEHELYPFGPEVAFANIRSFNRWLEEDWGYDYQDRIFGVPILSLADIDLAVAELERVLEAGARIVHLQPGPVAYGRSPADPEFDPFWARVQEAEIPVVYHIGNANYNELIGVHWGLPAHPCIYDATPFAQLLGLSTRPISDTLAALVLGDLFGRFPRLKVLSVENGSSWVGSLLDEMDHATKLSRISWSSRPGKPSEIFKEHVYIAPFWEDSGTDLAGIIGADHVLMGSDYPHSEGEDDPVNFVDCVAGLSERDTWLVMHQNVAGLLRIA